MKILQSGRRDGWRRQFTCTGTATLKGCGAVLEAEAGDLRRFDNSRAGLVCPECTALTLVPLSTLPPWVAKGLRDGPTTHLQEGR